MHSNNYIYSGKELSEAKKALILLHGRGGSAEDILSLAEELPVADFAWVAPQAAGHSWYPSSFLAPPMQNEPSLTTALEMLKGLVNELKAAGLKDKDIYFTGFSQGACLTLEYVTRNAARYGGVMAFTGGLIGDRLYPERYQGDFVGTPVFIGTSDPDMHVPVERVKETTQLLQQKHAVVTERIYPRMGHTITREELKDAVTAIFG